MAFLPVIKHPGLYADLGKRSSDLLSKEFPATNSSEVKFKTTAEGLAPDVSITRNAKDGSLSGKVGVKYYVPSLAYRGVSFGLSSDGKTAKGEIVADNTFVNGLKATATTEPGKNSVDLEYKHEYFTVSTGLDTRAGSANLRAAAVVGQNGYALGALTEYSVTTSKLAALTLTGSYTQRNTVFTAFARINTDHVGASVYHKVNSQVAVALDALYGYKDSKTQVTVGTAYDLDSNTAVKGKIDSTGKAAFSVSQRVSPFARVILGTGLQVNNLSTGGAPTFGATLSLNN